MEKKKIQFKIEELLASITPATIQKTSVRKCGLDQPEQRVIKINYDDVVSRDKSCVAIVARDWRGALFSKKQWLKLEKIQFKLEEHLASIIPATIQKNFIRKCGLD